MSGGVMANCQRHHIAPPVVEGVSPFRTPGTRCKWATVEEWIAHAEQLLRRRCAAKTYFDQASHIDELARHPDFIAAHDRDSLEQLRAFIERWYRPHKGSRAGTSYERVINTINNQLHWLARERA